MRIRILVFALLVLSTSTFAQDLKGILIDEGNDPIQSVSILNMRNGLHAHSNEEGAFSFKNVLVGDTLLFSHISYKDVMLKIVDLDEILEVIMLRNAINLAEIEISPKINALQLITDIDIQTDPVNSSQDVLRKVPGLFIGQHAGGGKAEQIFLRGFDIDHGTDVNITVDGMPVNMVSHAHGQGYADLHFVIPETIDKIDFGKGPYYQDKGNFTTAGYVDLKTKDGLEHNSIELCLGKFDTYRLMSAIKLLNNTKHKAYFASEYISTDGPFESPQNFNRVNLFGKYSGFLNDSEKLGVSVSHFNSKWDASGQIPQRAVDDQLISRFGAIDDTEGGSTSRKNIVLDYYKSIDENAFVKSKVYFSQYDFELYSNFTFFLEDPVNGDQIKQKESRSIFGLSSKYKRSFSSKITEGNWELGISFRNDRNNDVELSHTLNRKTNLEQIKLGDINETNLAVHLGSQLNVRNWSFIPSIRLDYFDFQYNDALLGSYMTQSQTQSIISPKFNILYNVSHDIQLYLKAGKGFHSNDTRVVLEKDGEDTLPAAYGFDIGHIWKPTPKMFLNMAYWYLYLEQEFIYVGDAGIVEPGGKTRRSGVDLSYRYQLLPYLFWNLDINYTIARTVSALEGEDYIPLAVDFALVSGINIIHGSGVFGSLNVRHLGDRPANDDNTIIAKAYTVTDLNLGYKSGDLGFAFHVQNLFNVEWNETQFATESRLFNENASVDEIHFTPGTPFYVKASIQYDF